MKGKTLKKGCEIPILLFFENKKRRVILRKEFPSAYQFNYYDLMNHFCINFPSLPSTFTILCL